MKDLTVSPKYRNRCSYLDNRVENNIHCRTASASFRLFYPLVEGRSTSRVSSVDVTRPPMTTVAAMGCFHESKLLEQLFEEVVARCLAVGLVRGDKLSVEVNRTVREYLAELEMQKPSKGTDA
jgi:hypothetical protein